MDYLLKIQSPMYKKIWGY